MVLSIIIPVYNAKDYLVPCIESIVGLNLSKDYEIILVDDGSNDGSGTLCDKLGSKNKEIKVIHQKNQGVSSARNCGLKIAKGKWIWFVDADDMVESFCQGENLATELKEEHFAVMDCLWDENGERFLQKTVPGFVPYNLWRCCFRNDILRENNLYFTVNRKYAEDQEFILKYLLCMDCHSVTKTIKSTVYHYFVRQGSTMTKFGTRSKHLADLSKVDLSFIFRAIKTGNIHRKWVWVQQKRITKAIFNVLTH